MSTVQHVAGLPSPKVSAISPLCSLLSAEHSSTSKALQTASDQSSYSSDSPSLSPPYAFMKAEGVGAPASCHASKMSALLHSSFLSAVPPNMPSIGRQPRLFGSQ